MCVGTHTVTRGGRARVLHIESAAHPRVLSGCPPVSTRPWEVRDDGFRGATADRWLRPARPGLAASQRLVSVGALPERTAVGTVREDYSADGDAWGYLPHDHARSRAYRWGEDGLAGFCDIE